MFTSDCVKAHKSQKGQRGLPPTMIANSKTIKSFLEFLAERGNNELKKPVEDMTEMVIN